MMDKFWNKGHSKVIQSKQLVKKKTKQKNFVNKQMMGQENVLSIVTFQIKAVKGSRVLEVYALLDHFALRCFCLNKKRHKKVLAKPNE